MSEAFGSSLVERLRSDGFLSSASQTTLYATPRRDAETLFFQHLRSPEGYYYKDHRSSPGREYEFIEFESPVDIREVEASVNFYKGDCPEGPRGEVRIEFKDAAIIIFKDGRQKTFSLSEVARIEFEPAGSNEPQFGRNHYLGKWQVGDGAGSHFFITLEADGNARKTIGANHGTWTVVNGEARISWDDGWHDAIRKAGSKHEKVAFEPGRSFTDEPSNVTDAKNTNPQPI